MRLRFRFRTLPFIATLLLVLLGVALGNWQTRRAAEKTALQARLVQRAAAPLLVLDGSPVDPAAVEYRHAVVTGEFVSDWPLYLDNRPFDGRSGFVLLMPFKIEGTQRHVLVARGWLPRDPAAHDRVPHVATPAGRQTLTGTIVLHPPRVLQLGAQAAPAPGAIVQNLDPVAFARASRLDTLPLLVEQTGTTDNAAAPAGAAALVRRWPAPATDVDRHKGYAFQWYALAAMAGLFFVTTGCRRGARSGSEARGGIRSGTRSGPDDAG